MTVRADKMEHGKQDMKNHILLVENALKECRAALKTVIDSDITEIYMQKRDITTIADLETLQGILEQSIKGKLYQDFREN
jgi:hypothetical protein